MSSIDKLKRLTGENIKVPEKSATQKPDIAELRRRIDDVMTRRREKDQLTARQKAGTSRNNLQEHIPGEEIENDLGKFFLVSNLVRGSSRHGYRNIRETFGFDMTAAAMLANNPCISEFACTDALFLDTETTGLAGGTGTIAFLIGLGWFAGGHFHMRQILSRDFGEEKAALTYLSEIAGQKKFLVTFNGKAFDVNLLTTRFIMNRLSSDLAQLPHLDLLHPSRRILGHRLENSRLATLEAQVLGVQREGDIPGWEIPQRYFDWLRSRDGRLLAAIIEHNRLDVISMASLTAHLTEILTGIDMVQKAACSDYLAAARLSLNRREPQRAAMILNIFQGQSCDDLSDLPRKQLANLYKRTGRLSEAVQLWEEMAAATPVDFSAISELAKWLEHHAHDYYKAKMMIEKAMGQDNKFSEEEKESLRHRLKRLNTKVKGN
jgi:uncharacterized protein